MKHYLSFGGGVNSVALYLLMQDLGMEFEAVYVDHGADWPETLEYVAMFAAKYPLTVLNPNVQGFSGLYDYYLAKAKAPSIVKRDCTDKFKLRAIYGYVTTPCFMHLGIDAGESHRARMNSRKGVENRYLLIEEGVDRDGCEQIIKNHGLPVPSKSGCFICMFQRPAQWRLLRRLHPDLFCKAQKLEKAAMQARKDEGKKPFTLCNNGKKIGDYVNDRQVALPGMEDLEYPPCQCGL
jgi:hypothetical protein